MYRTLCAVAILLPGASQAQLPTDIYLGATSPDVRIVGASSLDQTGYGFALGDFNGDTHSDFAVLSRGEDTANGYAFVSVLWGPPPLPSSNDLANCLGVSLVRASPGQVGWLAQIASGDFDGDGLDDIALGIPCQFPYADCDGIVYVIFGRTVFPDSLELNSQAVGVTKLLGMPGADGALGSMLAVWDLDRDGIDELIIAAPLSVSGSQIYVLWGRSSFPPQIAMADPSSLFTRIIDSRPYQSSGKGLACGDVNGDLWPDLLIGSPGEGQDNGEATLLLGTDTYPDTILIATQPPASKRFLGAGPYDQTGYRVAITDMNGDGCGDMVLSSYAGGPNGCEACGEVDVVLGGTSLPASAVLGSPGLRMLRLIGAGTGTSLGVELTCGDVNGDGFGDVMLMSKQDLYDVSDSGHVTVVYGSFVLPDSIHVVSEPSVTRIHAESRDNNLGRGLAAFDMTDDGIDDLLIGAPDSSPLARYRAGTVYIIFGPEWSTGVGPLDGLSSKQNHPNPFRMTTGIPVVLATDSDLYIAIYDVRGRVIRQLASEHVASGEHVFEWDGRDAQGRRVAAGVYFCRTTTDTRSSVIKMTVLR
ncbi:MAG: T9SS type A sorting domain-containing protein [Candidatus Krumholzibacteria bacterium]|nr:T9SS type A sorting domain-containing protein [Candidatus Krumholzibacteria bacterium]MDH4337569.1 T9SS type A sorting domain-containing protein [Candidatus Krumholzibacteria bacterium]MDH5269904.1 T9SS type A sorting domain-containing protein [Candidatus Krumholzibacteria bacterium]